jgi:hypothetical protein
MILSGANPKGDDKFKPNQIEDLEKSINELKEIPIEEYTNCITYYLFKVSAPDGTDIWEIQFNTMREEGTRVRKKRKISEKVFGNLLWNSLKKVSVELDREISLEKLDTIYSERCEALL